MKKNFTSISTILDRSGSMDYCLESTIKGYNAFIQKQRDASIGECVASLHQFDNQYQTDYLFRDINTVPELNTSTYQPRGRTALHDAVGKTIVELGQHLAKMNECDRPDTVIVAILTDGLENASKEFSPALINEMISKQSAVYSWEFVFLGANQDAITTAGDIGIKSSHSITYAQNDSGTREVFNSMSDGLVKMRHKKQELYVQGNISVESAQAVAAEMDVFTEEDRQTQYRAGARKYKNNKTDK